MDFQDIYANTFRVEKISYGEFVLYIGKEDDESGIKLDLDNITAIINALGSAGAEIFESVNHPGQWPK